MNNKKQIIYIICVIITIMFIYGNSLLNGDFSTKQSSFVMTLCNSILEFLNMPYVSPFFIRKAAHFTEYFILGTFLMLTLDSFNCSVLKNMFNYLFVGLFVPVTDEALQMFSDGRSPEVRDILIDFSGVVIGFVCILFILRIYRKFHDKINNA